MDGRSACGTWRQTGGSAREGDAGRRGEQPCSRHGARPGRHRTRDRAGHADPGFLRGQRRAVPARLRLRRTGLPDALLQRSRGGAGSRPHRAAKETRPGCRVALRLGRRQHEHRHRARRHDRLVIRPRRRLHRRTAKRAGVHRRADGPQGRRPRALPVHRSADQGRPRRRRRHLRRADRHRTRRADWRAETRRSRRGGRCEGSGPAVRATRWSSPHR